MLRIEIDKEERRDEDQQMIRCEDRCQHAIERSKTKRRGKQAFRASQKATTHQHHDNESKDLK